MKVYRVEDVDGNGVHIPARLDLQRLCWSGTALTMSYGHDIR